jgi:Protein of unknown function (DUF1073)
MPDEQPTDNAAPADLGPIANYANCSSAILNQEDAKRQQYQLTRVRTAMQTMSALTGRIATNNNFSLPFDFNGLQLFRWILDGARNIDAECGYPEILTPWHYTAMYDREGPAKRVVECEPEETWAMDPLIYDDIDPDNKTDFETEWDKFERKYNVWHNLLRLDILSGIGRYGILVFGIDDGKDWSEPVEGINDDGTYDEKNEYKLLYLRPFDESVTRVMTLEADPTSPRYGLPVLYTVLYRDTPSYVAGQVEIISRNIHWTRLLHAADNLKMSPIYGIPRQQQVYNRLYDLRKIYAASGEAYWKGAFPGLVFETHPEVENQGPQTDEEIDQMKKKVEAFQAGQQHYLSVSGMQVKALPPTITAPGPVAETHLKSIALSKGIPFRVLFGSEEAKLASDQDSRAWERRLGKRKTKYVTPMLIRPFIDRCIAYGLLPKPEIDYEVEWPDTTAPTEKDQATIALAVSQALAQYVQSGAYMVMEPLDYLTEVMKFDREHAKKMLQRSTRFNGAEDDEDMNEQGDKTKTGSTSGGMINPPTGSAMETPNLARTTTAGTSAKGGRPKQVNAVLPSLMPMPMNKASGNGKHKGR